MTTSGGNLEDHYTLALQHFLTGGGEPALQQAYDLGRIGLAEGLGVVDMAALYQRALVRAHPISSDPAGLGDLLRTSGSFLVESLSPFEMVHRGFKEAIHALRGLNRTLEEEAKRIAHALHDEAGQLLACVHIALQNVKDDLPSECRPRLDQVKDLLDQIEAQLRHLSHELRPTILDDLGLVPALKFLAEGVSSRGKISVTVRSATMDRLPPDVETAMYRIIQEALSNVVRHAHATRADVSLQQETNLFRCSIEDDGVGFDPDILSNKSASGGLGLIGIRERMREVGGTLAIRSRPSRGTTLLLEIPLGV